MSDLVSRANQLFTFSQSVRRDLHRHPELGFKEFRTAGIVAQELRQLGCEVSSGIAETGVVGLIEGDQPGPVVLARFDMDALPVEEQTGAEYASETPGVMHACGHDGHVAVGLTVARMLSEQRESLKGTVKLVFQPAEEGLGGAERLIKEGVLENPRPNVTLALHIWNERPVGWIAAVPGPFMAGGDFFKVRMIGKGGHGALPNTTADPVLASAQWITAVQSIVSRKLSPLQSGVVSVTSIHGGEAFNVIPGSVEMWGTIRRFENNVETIIHEQFEQLANGIAAAMGCRAETEIHDLTPPVVNDPAVTEMVQSVAREIFPQDHLDTRFQSMVSEDMAFMMQEVPGCYFMVGSANPEKGLNAGHHHPRFDFDEAALPKAAALMTGAVMKVLSRG